MRVNTVSFAALGIFVAFIITGCSTNTSNIANMVQPDVIRPGSVKHAPQLPETSSLLPPTQVPPMQAAAAGFQSLAFDDEFNSLSLAPSGGDSSTDNWYPGLWYEDSGPSSSQTQVNSGVLDLDWTRSGWSSSGLCDATVEGESNSALSGQSFRYGYFEARMKWDNVTGAWPAFWLLPVQAIEGQQNTGELDIFEGQGLDPTYYGTLHTWDGSTPLWASSPNAFSTPAGTDFTQWHEYGLLWNAPENGQPGSVTWYFDNVSVGSASTTNLPNSVFDQQNYFLILSSQEGVNWNSCEPQSDGSAASINLYVDWVHVWEK